MLIRMQIERSHFIKKVNKRQADINIKRRKEEKVKGRRKKIMKFKTELGGCNMPIFIYRFSIINKLMK